MLNIFYALIIGLSAGALGGMFGTGGGILIVPGLVLALGFSQHKAQGTSLACLLAPIGLLGVLSYQQKGMVDWRVAALVAIGFLGGSLFGAKLALNLDPLTMKRSFAIFLVLVAGWMWFSPMKAQPAQNEAQSEASPA
jgi:uncharacterized membrane protein YfcA